MPNDNRSEQYDSGRKTKVKPWGAGYEPTFNKTNVEAILRSLPRDKSELLSFIVDNPLYCLRNPEDALK